MRLVHFLVVPAVVAAVAVAAAAPAVAQAPMFTSGSVQVGDASYPFQLLLPPPRHRSAPLPLVVYLHGAGERGTDNVAQRKWLPDVLASPEWQERQPCFLLAVQCPPQQQWVAVPWGEPHGAPFPAEPSPALKAVLAAMDAVLAQQAIDAARVYLTGLSMGGYGCWDLAARHPERFAAMLAVCGGGDSARAHRYVGLPVCVYHGADDPVVPVGRSRAMVEALRRLGLAVEYHELPGVGHDAWRQAYGEHGSLDWLFHQDQRQQLRGAAAVSPLLPTPDRSLRRQGEFRLGAQPRCVVEAGAESAGAAFAAVFRWLLGRPRGVFRARPRAGDVEFRVDGSLGVAIEIDAGPVLRVAGADAAGLWRGAVASWQLLQGTAGPACPAGTWSYSPQPAEVWLGLGEDARVWSKGQQRELIALCFLNGVGGITAGPLVGAALAGPCRALGIRVAAPGEVPDGATHVDVVQPTGEPLALADLLAVPAARGGQALLLPLPAQGPDQLLALLRTRLPAVVERQHVRSRPVHLGGFLARIGSLLRAVCG
jgi:predicted esterase